MTAQSAPACLMRSDIALTGAMPEGPGPAFTGRKVEPAAGEFNRPAEPNEKH
jgi:hypothetical protein